MAFVSFRIDRFIISPVISFVDEEGRVFKEGQLKPKTILSSVNLRELAKMIEKEYNDKVKEAATGGRSKNRGNSTGKRKSSSKSL